MIKIILLLTLISNYKSYHINKNVKINKTKLYSSQSSKNNKAHSEDLELYDSNLIIQDNNDNNKLIIKKDILKSCYFDKRSICTRNNVCPFDERPCKSNRAYFDDIFNTDKTINNDNNIMQFNTYSNQEKKYYYDNLLLNKKLFNKKELRIKRQKLFLMSTWLDDILPDPHQGKDILINTFIDFYKIITRSILLILSMINIIKKPKIIDYFDNFYQ